MYLMSRFIALLLVLSVWFQSTTVASVFDDPILPLELNAQHTHIKYLNPHQSPFESSFLSENEDGPHQFPIDMDDSRIPLPWYRWELVGNPEYLHHNSAPVVSLDVVVQFGTTALPSTNSVSLITLTYSPIANVQHKTSTCFVYTTDDQAIPLTFQNSRNSVSHIPTITISLETTILQSLAGSKTHIQCCIPFKLPGRPQYHYLSDVATPLFWGGVIRYYFLSRPDIFTIMQVEPLSAILNDPLVLLEMDEQYYDTPNIAESQTAIARLSMKIYDLPLTPGDTIGLNIPDTTIFVTDHCRSKASSDIEQVGLVTPLLSTAFTLTDTNQSNVHVNNDDIPFPDPNQDLPECSIKDQYSPLPTSMDYFDSEGLLYTITRTGASHATFTFHRSIPTKRRGPSAQFTFFLQPQAGLRLSYRHQHTKISIPRLKVIRGNTLTPPAILSRVNLNGSRITHNQNRLRLSLKISADSIDDFLLLQSDIILIGGIPLASGCNPLVRFVGTYYDLECLRYINLPYLKLIVKKNNDDDPELPDHPFTETTITDHFDIPTSHLVRPFSPQAISSTTPTDLQMEYPVHMIFSRKHYFPLGHAIFDPDLSRYPIQHVWFSQVSRLENQTPLQSLAPYRHYLLHFRVGFITHDGLIWVRNTALGIRLELRYLFVRPNTSGDTSSMTISCQYRDPSSQATVVYIPVLIDDSRREGIMFINTHTSDIDLSTSVLECRNIPVYIGEPTAVSQLHVESITLEPRISFRPSNGRTIGLDAFKGPRALHTPHNIINILEDTPYATIHSHHEPTIGGAVNFTLSLHHLDLYRVDTLPSLQVYNICFDAVEFLPAVYFPEAQLHIKSIDYNDISYPTVDHIFSVRQFVDKASTNCIQLSFDKRKDLEYLQAMPHLNITGITPIIAKVHSESRRGYFTSIASAQGTSVSRTAISHVYHEITGPYIRPMTALVDLVEGPLTPTYTATGSPYRLHFTVTLADMIGATITTPYPLHSVDMFCLNIDDQSLMSAMVQLTSPTEIFLGGLWAARTCHFFADIFYQYESKSNNIGVFSYNLNQGAVVVETPLQFPSLDILPPGTQLDIDPSMSFVDCSIYNSPFAPDDYLQLIFLHPLSDTMMNTYHNRTVNVVESLHKHTDGNSAPPLHGDGETDNDGGDGDNHIAHVTYYYFPSSRHLDYSTDIHAYVQQQQQQQSSSQNNGSDSNDVDNTTPTASTSAPKGQQQSLLTTPTVAELNTMRPITVAHISFPNGFTVYDVVTIRVAMPYTIHEPGHGSLALLYLSTNGSITYQQLHIAPRHNQYDLSLAIDRLVPQLQPPHQYQFQEMRESHKLRQGQQQIEEKTHITIQISPIRFAMHDVLLVLNLENAAIIPAESDVCSYMIKSPEKEPDADMLLPHDNHHDANTPLALMYGPNTKYTLTLNLPTVDVNHTIIVTCLFDFTPISHLRKHISASLIDITARSHYHTPLVAQPPSREIIDPVYSIIVECNSTITHATNQDTPVDHPTLVLTAFSDVMLSAYRNISIESIVLDQFTIDSNFSLRIPMFKYPTNPHVDFHYPDRDPKTSENDYELIQTDATATAAQVRFRIMDTQDIDTLLALFQPRLQLSYPGAQLAFELASASIDKEERRCLGSPKCGANCNTRCPNLTPCVYDFDCESLYCNPRLNICDEYSSNTV